MRKVLIAFALLAALVGSAGFYALSIGTATHAVACVGDNNC
jgi:hypothetical protein